MPVRLVTGKSGSGKTLFMLHQLIKRYFTYDKKEEIFKPKNGNYLVITNIDGFSQDIPHFSLSQEIERISFLKMIVDLKKMLSVNKLPDMFADLKSDTLSYYYNEYDFQGISNLPPLYRDFYIENYKDNQVVRFFQNKSQKKYLEGIHSGKNVFYIIDEAQNFFPTGFRDHDAVYFFEYHRHYGCEVYFSCQHRNRLSRDLRGNIEVEYNAMRKSITSGKFYAYNVLYDGIKAGTEILRNPSQYYGLYESAFTHSDVKEKNYVFRIILVSSLLLILGVSLITYRFLFHGFDDRLAVASEKKPAQQNPFAAKTSQKNQEKIVKNEIQQPKLEWQKVPVYCINSKCYFLNEYGDSVPIPKNHKKIGRSYYLYMPVKEEKKIFKRTTTGDSYHDGTFL